MENVRFRERIAVRLLPPEANSLPGRYKICADVRVPGQRPINSLRNDDRLKVGEMVAKRMLKLCPSTGPIAITVDGVKKDYVNVGVYTETLSDVHALRDAGEVYPSFACDISDPEKPKFLPNKDWLKK
ncbi:MAG TPA: hypothetical protein VMY36_00580 [Patescibacteria group bacterium]|nr:hypothetical protein [Patescibacteria group bacterium]